MNLRLLFVIISLATLHCSAEGDTNGWRGMLKDSLSKPLLTTPKIESRVEEKKAIIRITNISAVTLSYRARGASGPVLYFETYEKDDWRTSGWDWCGTGVEEFTILPGKSVEMTFYSGLAEPGTRIYTIITDPKNKRASAVLLMEQKRGPANLEPQPTPPCE